MTGKRIIALALVLGMLTASMSFTATAAGTDCGESYTGTNVGAQDYGSGYPFWSDTIKSYLVPTSDGLMRVQAGGDIPGVFVEYYDGSHNILRGKSKLIEAGLLPIFGGFYASDDAYYILSGQANQNESNSVEVFRVSKYDKNWNLLGSDGLFGANTVVPFDAGSARMEEYGGYLLIRTAHTMYKSDDGFNHQANVTIEFNTKTMKITDSYTKVMNVSYGYVSHSFNQFIHVENGHIVAVDHGDASPRSIALIKYQTDVTSGKFVPGYSNPCTYVNVIKFAAAENYNNTGASVGAFLISGSSYLVAGNSVTQDANMESRQTNNVFVAAVNKSTNAVSMNWLTNYAEGDGTTSTPHMVKLSEDRFLVLWARGGNVYYTEVNGLGETVGATHKMMGELSDCVPVVADGKVTWYTWQNENITFYDIDVSDISVNSRTTVKTGHDYEVVSCSGGVSNLRCRVCGKTTKVNVYTSFSILWSTERYGTYSTGLPSDEKYVGDKLYFLFWGKNTDGVDINGEWAVDFSDDSVVSYKFTDVYSDEQFGYFTMVKPGTVTVKMYPKYNPSIAKTFTITVKCVHEDDATGITELVGAKEASCTETGYTGDLVCTVCGGIVEAGSVIPKKPHHYDGGHCVDCGAEEPEYILGDANGDGDINNADALAIFRYIFDSSNPISFEAADVNRSNTITNEDALAIFKYIFDADQYPLG